ncbi:Oidioi.mRNA.OKI2018_I69.chr1.g1115.t1.cds [Oikopleura dioica]|uniref:Oidioi.mRNA.OKI2018_I69.chr1.g1115.t1.cds n=1 Tax=Oikopleura dioica TaxID=34765 RepID=A0ABN7SQJ0_OIKDI|nr:Oidioi.mRNA.OKI2018_I69.chr1.g1115.t1.cds [Oikopleura dioica]
MMKYARSFQPEYVLSIGDHFYFNGVVDEHDLRWKKTFEEVYDSEELMVPWYPAMGNHDWNVLPPQVGDDDLPRRGNGWAQIKYGQDELGTKRWTHPDPFFTTEYTTEDGVVVKTIMIDTPMFSGVYTGGRPKPNTDSDGNKCNVYDLDPKCVNNIAPVDPKIAAWAWEWIEKELENSNNADYLFVAGHYQVVDTEGIYDYEIFRKLEPLMEQFNVTAYFQGHRHTMEHAQRSPKLQPENETITNNVHYFTFGAGALLDTGAEMAYVLTGEIRPEVACHPRNEPNDFDNGSAICHKYWFTKKYAGGFGAVNITKDRALVSMISSEVDNLTDAYKVEYSFDIKPRK